jgi:hypothetical protein
MHWALLAHTARLVTDPLEALFGTITDEKSVNWTFLAQLLQFSLARRERETIVIPVFLSFI